MKKKILILFGALLLCCSMPLSVTFAANGMQFKDVPPSKHYAEAVYNLAERNIIGGYPDGTFKPGNSITRGQAAAIIAKLIKLDTEEVKDPGFKDVSLENGYYKAIAAMAENGIISGYGDGNFGPNDPIKRGQMASILVKAFDLPRYRFYDIKNPFKDVVEYESHGTSILIIYKLGITTGTSPDKFSPNAPITRGQAAKMIKATEDRKPTMVTFKASDFGWDNLGVVYEEKNSDLFKSFIVYGKKTPSGNTEDRLQLVPLKEGEGTLNLYEISKDEGNSVDPYKYQYKKFYVHIKKVNGELELTLEETNDFLPTKATLTLYKGELAENVAISTVDGKKISDNFAFKKSPNRPDIYIDLDQPGEYIATVRFDDGKEVRYGIEVKQPTNALFTYDIKTLREQLSIVYDVEKSFFESLSEDFRYDENAAKNIGKHKILTNNAEEIAEVTRDSGTNVFRATAKNTGSIEIEFENNIPWVLGVPGDAMSGSTTGISINVQRMGEITNISVSRIEYINPDH
ncbi:S-layer homology domain-containing protein [Solibacillus sp. CAU 1738]|uniref:S-layer homology domain-containing protein n=1 Tax=Solibacillus sp. CAU 1738 TaxID=3140363 RepID=UPI003260D748